MTTARPDAARVEICDLHTHSTVSDGTCEPAEVVRRAHRVGVSALALTDHDATDGLAEATREASALGVDFLTGIEVSAGAGGVEVHVLGYGFDPRDPALVDLLDGLRAERARRVPRMLDRLRALGVDVEPDAVFRIAGRGSVGRPHVARALVAAGACRSVDQAFERFLGRGRPAFVEKPVPAAAEAIAVLNAAGGTAVLAHPLYGARDRPGGLDALVAPLAGAGLGGLETHYVSHTPRERRRVERVARRHGLLRTGGSDFHGQNRPGVEVGVGRGALAVPRTFFDALRERSTAPVA